MIASLLASRGLWQLALATNVVLTVAATPVRAQTSTAPAITLERGLVLTKSARISPRTYRLSAPTSLDSAVVVIHGDNITVDFDGATLEGTDPSADPDVANGIAIRIDGGSHVRILNAR